MGSLDDECPLVSVAIVCFNHKAYVEQCVKSVVQQTYKNIELYVVDNGSNDGTVDLLLNLKEQYKFHLITNPSPTKLVDSLNALADLLNGQYLCFVAADDYWTEDKIRLQVLYMTNNPEVGSCSGRMYIVDRNQKPVMPAAALKHCDLEFRHILLGRYYFPAPVAMIRRQAIDEVGWYDTSLIVEDYQMWLKLTYGKWKLGLLRDILGYYRRHNGNISAKMELIHEERLSTIQKYSDTANFSEAYQAHLLLGFNSFCATDKLRAIKLIPSVVRNVNCGLILKSLILLFIPKSVFKFIRGYSFSSD